MSVTGASSAAMNEERTGSVGRSARDLRRKEPARLLCNPTLTSPFALPSTLIRSNPFLIRELRQHARRWEAVQGWTAGFAALWSLPLFWALFLFATDGTRPAGGGTTGIQVMHLLVCVCVGLYGGYRVYEAEKANHTLEAVLLLPHRPTSWLVQKTMPALLLGATCVGLAFPIYLSAVILGVERMDALPRIMGQAVLAVLGGMSLTLLFPPRYDAPPPTPGKPIAGHGRALWIEGSKLMLLILVPGVIALASAGRVLGPRTWILLYGWQFPLWPLLIGVGTLGFVSVVLTAATPIGPETWDRRAGHFRLATCALLYYLGAGILWQRLPLPASLLLLVLPGVALAISERFRPQQRTDPWIEGDLRRVARWSENPVLLLDYRIHTRRASLLRSFLGGLVFGIGLVLTCRLFSGSWMSTLRTLMTSMGYVVWNILFTSLGSAAAVMWQKEAAANALPSLLLSPLSSREILKGRWGAAWVRSLGGPLGMALPILLLPLLVAPALVWKVAAGPLGMLPFLVTTNLCQGFSFSEKGMPRPPLTNSERDGYWSVWVLHLVGFVGCGFAIGFGVTGKPWSWPLAGVAFLLHAWAARWMFELKVRRLESVRTADFGQTD